MMKLRLLLRACVPCLLLAVAPLLSHCGEAAGFGTETGNPPQLEEKQLYLEVVADGLRVVGSPGAIAPPGAAVRVTNITTGASVETTAANDGSIDLVIAGAAGDELEVTVTSGGQQASERISFTELARRTDLSGVSCPGLEDLLLRTLGEVFTAADADCTTDIDCVSLGFGAAVAAPDAEELPCYYECGLGFISRQGALDVVAQGPERTAAVCAALEACDRQGPSSCGGGLLESYPVCVAGRCQGVDPNTLSCDDFLEPAEARRAQLRAAADKRCVADSDCALADVSVRCIVECGDGIDSVARSAAPALETLVRDEVYSPYCAPFLARGCTLPDLDCSAPDPGAAFCDAGTCALRFPE